MRLTRGTVAVSAAMLMASGAAGFGTAHAQETIAFEDVVHLSCAEVAEESGDDEARIVEMVRVLAAFSLEKRGLVVPEDRDELGLQFGDLIRAFCTAEPDGRLYNAVHRAMQRLL